MTAIQAFMVSNRLDCCINRDLWTSAFRTSRFAINDNMGIILLSLLFRQAEIIIDRQVIQESVHNKFKIES